MIADLRIALIQSDLHWENVEANLAMFEEKIWAIQGQVDLIVLPEMFTTGFTMNSSLAEPMNSKTFRWMAQQAAQTKAVIMGSYIVQEKGICYNRLFAVYPDGTFKKYDKKHLFGLAGEDQAYVAGKSREVIEVNGWKLLPLICYDLRFPVWSRSKKGNDQLYEYDAVIYCANWPQPRIHAWDTLLAARAIENSSYAIGVNRTGKDGSGSVYPGHSAVYDFLGNQLTYATEEALLTATLEHRKMSHFRSRFPFQRDADSFSIL